MITKWSTYKNYTTLEKQMTIKLQIDKLRYAVLLNLAQLDQCLT